MLPYLSPYSKVGFPDSSEANGAGLLAYGGRLTPEWLLEAYSKGIFPWFGHGDPILWWSPSPRCILLPADVKVSKSMSSMIRQGHFTVTYNEAFESVISCCASVVRSLQAETWITPSMINAYSELHQLGHAHSVEVWADAVLVGGLYGVAMGSVFFGESMFSKVSNASKYALIHACTRLHTCGYELIDCQVTSAHLLSMGAQEVDRREFSDRLTKALKKPPLCSLW